MLNVGMCGIAGNHFGDDFSMKINILVNENILRNYKMSGEDN